MKKRFILLIFACLFLLFAVIICMVRGDRKIMRPIGVYDIFDALDKKEDLIVYYGQEDCGSCREFSKTISRIMTENDVAVGYMDADQMSSDEKEEFIRFDIEMTPALIVVTKGKVYIYRNLENEKDIETAVTQIDFEEERFDGLKEISYEALDKKTKANLDFLLYIGREDCRDCQKFHPVVEQYISENPGMGIYYFDIKQYKDLANSDNGKKEDISFYDELKKRYQIEWVPSVVYFDGKLKIEVMESLQ